MKVECEVQNITEGNTEKFSKQRSFIFENYTNKLQIGEMYTKRLSNGDYIAQILGKNGEPIEKVEISAQFMSLKYKGKQLSNTYTTDKEGTVNLGKLNKVGAVHLKCDSLNLKKILTLLPNDMVTYPEQVDGLEDETFEFPVHFSKLKKTELSLYRAKEENILYDNFSNVELIVNKNKTYNQIKIKGLTAGTYTLCIERTGRIIPITIHKGRYWETDSFILKKDGLLENRQVTRGVKIADLKVSNNN